MKSPIFVTLIFGLVMVTGSAFGASTKESTDEVAERDDIKPKTVQAAPIISETTPVSAPTLSATSPATTTGDRDGEEINWQVLSSGGNTSTIGSFILGSTIGQTAAGPAVLGDLALNSGYWQNFDNECCVIRGDIDHSGSTVLDISDVIFMVVYMFQDGPPPVCMLELDVDGSSGIPDISDLIYLVSYCFQDGPPCIPCP